MHGSLPSIPFPPTEFREWQSVLETGAMGTRGQPGLHSDILSQKSRNETH